MHSLRPALQPSTIEQRMHVLLPPFARKRGYVQRRALCNHIIQLACLHGFTHLWSFYPTSSLVYIFIIILFFFLFDSRNANLSRFLWWTGPNFLSFCSNSRPLSNSDRELSSFQSIPVQAPWRCQQRIRSSLLFNLLITEGNQNTLCILWSGTSSCAPNDYGSTSFALPRQTRVKKRHLQLWFQSSHLNHKKGALRWMFEFFFSKAKCVLVFVSIFFF